MKVAFRAVFGLALVLLVVAAGVVSLSLGSLVKKAVVAAGPRLLGARVELDAVALAPWSGRGTLRGLVIGNPEGYKGAHAVKVGAVEIEVKLSSLFSDMVVVDRVVVREPEIVYEYGPAGSNLSRLQKNAEESRGFAGGEAKAAPAKPAKGKSLLIKDFSITGARMGLTATALGGQGLRADLPDIHLTDLGGPGRSPGEAAAQALRALGAEAQKAAAGAGSRALDQAAKSLAPALGDFLKKLKR